MSNLKNVKNALCFFISLFLVFNIVLLCLCSFIYIRLVNPEYYISVFGSTNYNEAVSANIEKELTIESRQRNLPKNVLAPFWEKTWIKKQIDVFTYDIVRNIINQKTEFKDIDFKSPEERYSEGFDEFLKSSNITIDERLQNEKNDLRLKAEQIVSNNINLFDIKGNMKTEEISVITGQLHNIYYYAWEYAVIFLAAFVVTPIVFKRNISKIFIWSGYAFSAAGLLMLFLSAAVYSLNISGSLPLSQEYVKLTLDGVIKGYLWYFSIAGVVSLILGLVFMKISLKRSD